MREAREIATLLQPVEGQSTPITNELDLNLLIVLLLATSSRVLMFFLGYAPEFPDTEVYYTAGQSLLTYGNVDASNLMPLYPLLSYLTGGQSGLITVDIIISVLTVWIVYYLANALFHNKRVGLIAGLISAVYPHFIFYSISRLTETLFVFSLLLVFLFYYQKRMLLGHVTLAISILVRPTLDLIAPIIIYIFSRNVHNDNFQKSIMHVLKYSLIYSLIMAPWWMHNYVKYGEFIRLNPGWGIVLYAGNNPMNESGGGIVGVDYTNNHVTGVTDPLIKNSLYAREAINYILEHPLKFFENGINKMIRFWRLWPHAPEYRTFPIILMSLLSYGVVLVVAVFTLLRLNRQQLKSLAPIFVVVVYFCVVHSVTIGSTRYRLPLEPFLIIIASYYFSRLFSPKEAR